MTTTEGSLPIRANSRPGGEGYLPLIASQGVRTTAGTLPLIARTAPYTTVGSLALTAHSDPVNDRPVKVYLGSQPRRYRASYGGVEVLSAEYTHTAQGRELVMIVAGARRVQAGASLSLLIEALPPYTGRLSISVPADGEYQIEQLPGGARTRLRGVDPEYAKLAARKLPELIPWVGDPSREIALPGYRSVTRQVAEVEAILGRAFAQSGMQVIVNARVLQSQKWEETRREYSTLGKTALQVFADTYGALNYELVRTGENAFTAYAPDEARYTIAVDGSAREPGSESRQELQYPSSVRLQVGDRFTDATGYLLAVMQTGKLPDQLPDENGKTPDPVPILDPQAAGYEIKNDAELYGTDTDAANGTRSGYYAKKTNGREVQTLSVTTGKIEIIDEVQGVRDGEPQKRVIENAVLSITETINEYLSPTSTTLKRTKTLTQRYAYAWFTELGSASLPAALNMTGVTGDLLGEESSEELYTYSHSGGFLRQQVKIETRISAVGQTSADSTDPSNPPSPPTALEKSVTTTTDTYSPQGNGLWSHRQVRAQAAKVPVLDLESGDWVKQIQAPLTTTKYEITDNPPPSVSDPEIGAPNGSSAPAGPIPPPFEYLRTPQIQTVPLTGKGAPLSFELPVVEDEVAAGGFTKQLALIHVTELKPRVTNTLKTSALEPLLPRIRVPGLGLVRSYKVSIRPGALTLEATCENRDA